MTIELISIFGMTAIILVGLWLMHRSLRANIQADLKDFRSEFKEELTGFRIEIKEDIVILAEDVKDEFGKIDVDFHELQTALQGVSERMARLDGLLEGIKEAIIARGAH